MVHRHDQRDREAVTAADRRCVVLDVLEPRPQPIDFGLQFCDLALYGADR